MAIIRPEQPGEQPVIGAILIAAFDTDTEARLVTALRGTPEWVPELSLVVQQEDRVVGYLLMSRMTAGESNALALGPVGVLPDEQGQGYGTALVQTALVRAGDLGFDCVIAVGAPAFFLRMGFRPARARALQTAMAIPDAAFLVAELRLGGVTPGETLWPEAWATV